MTLVSFVPKTKTSKMFNKSVNISAICGYKPLPYAKLCPTIGGLVPLVPGQSHLKRSIVNKINSHRF